MQKETIQHLITVEMFNKKKAVEIDIYKKF
jgi:hypothetical protein